MKFARSLATFAAGAVTAAAFSITGTGPWQVGAAPGDIDTTYVPTEPCRLLDTRANGTQGDRRAPLASGETFTAQVTGTNGDCSGIPTDATAVALNVTSLNSTERSFLAVYPADQAIRPNISSLNWIGGQSPTPNKVDVKLSADGAIKLFNNAGTVDVFVDVAGYYTSASLAHIDDRLRALEPPATTVITLGGFELRVLNEMSGWDYEIGIRHAPTALPECVIKHIDVETGQSVTKIAVNYVSDGQVMFEISGVTGRITSAGTFANEEALIHVVELADFAAPESGPGAVETAELTFIGDPLIRDDYRYLVQMCTRDRVEITSVEITLDNP